MLIIINSNKLEWFAALGGIMSKDIITQMDVKSIFNVSLCVVLRSMSGNLTKYFVPNYHRAVI
jgi:C-terminal processing protease CtpA/Prc